MNKYVKVKGHPNWFLSLDSGSYEPDGLSETMQEKILRSQVCQLHNPNPKNEMDVIHRIKLAATRTIDYESLANRYGTILIREIGSFMHLRGNEITEECYCNDFPLSEFGDIVICENDEKPEYKWVNYLKNRFPEKKIVTINYFDLRSNQHVSEFFKKAEFITFSTTFSSMSWFEKLCRLNIENKKVIGFCHDKNKWKSALSINPNIEIIESIG